MPWAAGTAAAGITAAGAAFSAKSANRESKKSAREQMAFQERMSNTSHQREVEDLRKAGLNPILSANTGASTPTGASYSAQAMDISDALEKGVSTAKTASQNKPQIKVMEAQSQAAVASAKQATTQAAKTQQEMDVLVPLQAEQIKANIQNTNTSSAMNAATTGRITGVTPGEIAKSNAWGVGYGEIAKGAPGLIDRMENILNKGVNSAKADAERRRKQIAPTLKWAKDRIKKEWETTRDYWR